MIKSTIQKILKSHLIPSNNYIYGFADLSGLLHKKFYGFSYGISIGRKLDDKIIDGIKDAPTIEYFHHYDEINKQLQVISEQIACELNEVGVGAVAIIPTIPISSSKFDQYLSTLRYDVSQKMIATRSGLGWIGKTDLFISPKFGVRVRLASILIDKEISPESKPINISRCGKCNICVERCPASAATGQLWDIDTDRDVFFDAFKCREKCSEFGRSLLKIDKRICGICVAVCPIGRKVSIRKLKC
jgi:epoxyqueuosine reductase